MSGAGAAFPAMNRFTANVGSLRLEAGASLATGQFLANVGRLTLATGATLTVDAFDQGPDARLTFLGTGPGGPAAFGRLAAPNGATFNGGTLEVGVEPGDATQAGDSYTLLAGPVAGIPERIVQSGTGGDPVFDVSVGTTAVTATAIGNVTDLGVMAVTPPRVSAAPGDRVTVGWTVQNRSAAATTATGWADAVYLSRSATFDDSAVLLGRVPPGGPGGRGHVRRHPGRPPARAGGGGVLRVRRGRRRRGGRRRSPQQ